MAQLEQDLAEVKQVTGSAYESWRVWSEHKQIYEEKNHHMGALMQAKELEAFMKPYHETAEDVVAASKASEVQDPAT